MLSRLPIEIEAGLEFSSLRRNDEGSDICECCSLDHVGNIVLVAWCVKDSDSLSLGIEVGLSYFHSFALGFLLFVAVHHVRQPPRVSSLLLSLILVLLNGSLVYDTHLEHQVSTNG